MIDAEMARRKMLEDSPIPCSEPPPLPPLRAAAAPSRRGASSMHGALIVPASHLILCHSPYPLTQCISLPPLTACSKRGPGAV